MRKSEHDRFWEKVDKFSSERGCWIWSAAKNPKGYGNFGVWDGVYQTMHKSHRYSWMIRYGPIPDGSWVLHRCDNPSCVNPDHLFLGTHQDNMTDKVSKGRASSMKGKNHPRAKLTENDVMAIRRLEGKLSSRAVARKFGLSKTHVLYIWKRISWGHLV